MSFMVVLTPFMISIIKDQDSLISQSLILVTFVSIYAIVCGVSVGLTYYETKSDKTNNR